MRCGNDGSCSPIVLPPLVGELVPVGELLPVPPDVGLDEDVPPDVGLEPVPPDDGGVLVAVPVDDGGVDVAVPVGELVDVPSPWQCGIAWSGPGNMHGVGAGAGYGGMTSGGE